MSDDGPSVSDGKSTATMRPIAKMLAACFCEVPMTGHSKPETSEEMVTQTRWSRADLESLFYALQAVDSSGTTIRHITDLASTASRLSGSKSCDNDDQASRADSARRRDGRVTSNGSHKGTHNRRLSHGGQVIPSHPEVLKQWEDKIVGEASIYRKMAKVHARMILDSDGLIEKNINSRTEVPCTKGDYVMIGTQGKQYGMSREEFEERYDTTNPEPSTDQKLAGAGFRLFQAVGKVWAHQLTADECAQVFPAGSFQGSWGGDTLVEEGDFLLVPFPGAGEIYSVRQYLFNSTYSRSIPLSSLNEIAEYEENAKVAEARTLDMSSSASVHMTTVTRSAAPADRLYEAPDPTGHTPLHKSRALNLSDDDDELDTKMHDLHTLKPRLPTVTVHRASSQGGTPIPELKSPSSPLAVFRSRRRSAYEMGDLINLVRSSMSEVVSVNNLFQMFDDDVDGLLDGPEFAAAMRYIVGSDLMENELEGLYDMISNSHDELRLCDFIDFFKPDGATNKLLKFQRSNLNTITSISISSDQCFIAYGAINCVARVYEIEDGKSVFEKDYEKQVATVVVSPSGEFLGVGCFAGLIEWIDISEQNVLHTWSIRSDVNCLALDSNATVLAAGGANGLAFVYSLKSGKLMYRFTTQLPICSVALATSTTHVLQLEDGRMVHGTRGVRLENGSLLDEVMQHADTKDREMFMPEFGDDNDNLSTYILGGTILQRSEEQSDALLALHQFLDSMVAISFTVALVITGIVIELFRKARMVSTYNTSVSEYLIFIILFCELSVRMFCFSHVEQSILKFFKKPLCLLDFLVIVIDVIFIALDWVPQENDEQGVVDGELATYVRALKTIRMIRLVRLLRIFRLVDRVTKTKEHVELEFDIMLYDGATIVRKIPDHSLLSVEAKHAVETFHARSSQISHTSPNEIASKHSARSVFGYKTGSGSKTGSWSKTGGGLHRNQSKELDYKTDSELKATLQRIQHLEEGTPVELHVQAYVHHTQTEEFIAIGGETQQVHVWQYGVTEADIQRHGPGRFSSAGLDVADGVFLDAASQRKESATHNSHSDDVVGGGAARRSRRFSDIDLETPETPRKGRRFSQKSRNCDTHFEPFGFDAPFTGGEIMRNTKQQQTTRNRKTAILKYVQTFAHTVNSVSLSGDGRRLAGGDASGELCLYDFVTETELFRWRDSGPIFGVDLSHSGERVVVCGSNKHARVFDVSTGAPIYDKKFPDRVRACKISGDGTFIATGNFNGLVDVCSIDHGASYHSFEHHSTVRSVSIDVAGYVLATGCDDGCCRVYDLRPSNSNKGKAAWSAIHRAKVWVVAVSPDGTKVAAGDYDDTVCVYAADSGRVVWCRSSWTTEDAPFTWGLSFSGDGGVLAIGKWNSYVYLLDTTNWEMLSTIKRGGRVYSVSLDHYGQRIAVGGRDKMAVVYSVDAPGQRRASRKMTQLLFSETRPSFIHAVALTRDGKHVCAGSVDNNVCIYNVDAQRLLHKINHSGAVTSISFSPDAQHLVIGGESKSVNVWKLNNTESPEEVLFLPRKTTVSSTAFSNASLCFASGSLVTIYGLGNQECEWSDRPGFEVIADLIRDERALRVMLTRHPCTLNACNPNTGESLLQFTVRGGRPERVNVLLSTDCRLGFLRDAKGHTALKVALKDKQKQVVEMLLSTMIKDIQAHPSALDPFIRHRVEIADKYPDIFLEFMQSVSLIREDKLTPNDRNTALLQSAGKFLVAGSKDREPTNLWSHLLEGNKSFLKTNDRETQPGPEGVEKIHNRYRDRLDCSSQEDRIDPNLLQRVMVVSLRVPFEGAISSSYAGVSRPETTLLYLTAQAASKQEDFSVFSSRQIQAMMQFKWETYASVIFRTQFCVYFLHLTLVSLFAFYGSQHVYLTDGRRFSMDTKFAVRAVCFGTVSVTGSFLLLMVECRQLLLDGRRSFFQDNWKFLNVATFAGQIFVALLFGLNSRAMQPFAAWSVLLSFFWALSFTRGFASVGPLVRMIVKIFVDVRFFFMIMLFILSGFSVAFSVALPADDNPLLWMFWLINSGLYGFADVISTELVPYKRMEEMGSVLLFEMLMVIVMLIMLNLLIAIMNSAYEAVRITATLEVMHEKAAIIHETERFWLPALLRRWNIDQDDLFPKWLHLLVPAAILTDGFVEDVIPAERSPYGSSNSTGAEKGELNFHPTAGNELPVMPPTNAAPSYDVVPSLTSRINRRRTSAIGARSHRSGMVLPL